MDTVTELMKPRFKVIADYPLSDYPIGHIHKAVAWMTEDFFLKYPAIFKKLEWWEDRKPEEMPLYIKHGANGKPRKIESFIEATGTIYFEGGRQRRINPDWIPSTEQEYLTYINTIQSNNK